MYYCTLVRLVLLEVEGQQLVVMVIRIEGGWTLLLNKFKNLILKNYLHHVKMGNIYNIKHGCFNMKNMR